MERLLGRQKPRDSTSSLGLESPANNRRHSQAVNSLLMSAESLLFYPIRGRVQPSTRQILALAGPDARDIPCHSIWLWEYRGNAEVLRARLLRKSLERTEGVEAALSGSRRHFKTPESRQVYPTHYGSPHGANDVP